MDIGLNKFGVYGCQHNLDLIGLMQQLQGPTQGPATIVLPQAPAGAPTALHVAAAEKYKRDVAKAYGP